MSAPYRYALSDRMPWVRDTAIFIYPDGSRILVSGGQDSAGKVGVSVGVQLNDEAKGCH